MGDIMQFEKYMDEYLDVKGNSQKTFGGLIGVSQTMVSSWYFKIKRISSEKVIPVAKATHWQCTPHDLRPDLYPHPNDGLPDELRGESAAAVFSDNRRVEQTAARLAHNQEVDGSNPSPATITGQAA
jgi:DNA-binding transcriptional regulator YdaS (Cro superfamily)